MHQILAATLQSAVSLGFWHPPGKCVGSRHGEHYHPLLDCDPVVRYAER